MTLSRFLRDYLYIPLGGNRCGPVRQAVNVVATMLLGGLWHGANWTFVAWGGLHGVALAVNHVWSGARLAPAAPARLAADPAVRHGLLGAVPRAEISPLPGACSPRWPACTASARIALDREYVIALVARRRGRAARPDQPGCGAARLAPRAWIAVPAGVALVYCCC